MSTVGKEVVNTVGVEVVTGDKDRVGLSVDGAGEGTALKVGKYVGS